MTPGGPGPGHPPVAADSSGPASDPDTRTVDVVVVAFGAPDLLARCLAKLGTTLPVTVVDNSSRPDVRKVAVELGATYLDPGRNLGFGAGVNFGLVRCRRPGSDVLLVNPDAAIDRAGVDTLGACLHARGDRGCVAPAQVDPVTGRPARVSWPFPSPTGAWIEAIGLGDHRRGDRFVIGAVLLVRAAMLDAVGPFDERFFLYAEETDLQRRGAALGWRAHLCPDVEAVHVGAGTDGDPTERDVHFHASNERYIRKYFGPAGWQVYRSGTMAGALVRAMVLPRRRAREAADRFHLYRRGPVRTEMGIRP